MSRVIVTKLTGWATRDAELRETGFLAGCFTGAALLLDVSEGLVRYFEWEYGSRSSNIEMEDRNIPSSF